MSQTSTMGSTNVGAPPASSGAASRWRSPNAIFLFVLAVTLLPPLLIRMPPMLDYPNHYVRMWMEAGGARDPAIAAMYRIDWHKAATNLGIDVVATVLGLVFPITVIGPVVLMLGLAVPILGFVLLSRQVHGRLSWWHVLGAMLAWNWVYLAGFLSFSISLGLAMLGAAAVLAVARKALAVRVLTTLLCGGVILLAHPFGFLFYGLILCGLAIGPDLAGVSRPPAIVATVQRLLVAGLPLVLLLALFWLLAPSHPGDHVASTAEGTVWGQHRLRDLASTLLLPFKTYRYSIDALFAIAFAVPVLWCLATRRLGIHLGLALVLVVMAGVALTMPKAIFGTWMMDTRIPAMTGWLFAVTVYPRAWLDRRGVAIASVLAAALVCARVGEIATIWTLRQGDVQSVERAIDRMPPRVRVLPIANYIDIDAPPRPVPIGRLLGRMTATSWHYPVLAIMRRGDFVPTLFSSAGEQPVTVEAPYSALAVPQGSLASTSAIAEPKYRSARDQPYLADWQNCFDYILQINADYPDYRGVPLPPASVRLVADEGFARVYRIIPGTAGGQCRSAPVRPAA